VEGARALRNQEDAEAITAVESALRAAVEEAHAAVQSDVEHLPHMMGEAMRRVEEEEETVATEEEARANGGGSKRGAAGGAVAASGGECAGWLQAQLRSTDLVSDEVAAALLQPWDAIAPPAATGMAARASIEKAYLRGLAHHGSEHVIQRLLAREGVLLKRLSAVVWQKVSTCTDKPPMPLRLGPTRDGPKAGPRTGVDGPLPLRLGPVDGGEGQYSVDSFSPRAAALVGQ